MMINKNIEIIMNLWNADKELSIIQIASEWIEEQIMKTIKKYDAE